MVAARPGGRRRDTPVARRRVRAPGPAPASPLGTPSPGTIMAVDTGDQHDLQVLEHAEGELEDIERALRRLDEGTYATCEVCGRAISDDRLARSPANTALRGSRAAGRPEQSGWDLRIGALLLFAQARERAGTGEARIDGVTVGEVLDAAVGTLRGWARGRHRLQRHLAERRAGEPGAAGRRQRRGGGAAARVRRVRGANPPEIAPAAQPFLVSQKIRSISAIWSSSFWPTATSVVFLASPAVLVAVQNRLCSSGNFARWSGLK